MKHRVFRGVISSNVSITNAEHFAAHADAIVNGIKSLYMPIDEVLDEQEDIEKSYPRTDGIHQRSIKLLVLSPLMVSVSWNSLKQRWMNNHFMYNIARRMGIQMFVVTLSFPCAIILIKRVLSAMVFMPKVRGCQSAVYVINGFMKSAFFFRFFLKYCSKTIFFI